mmetsp:Transcript_13549/g.15538  ORF Transcript_13549/g.15538 Transcript_13549/m.15538 type:complete len:109 (+) Transcript_13549:2115-2441(+)
MVVNKFLKLLNVNKTFFKQNQLNKDIEDKFVKNVLQIQQNQFLFLSSFSQCLALPPSLSLYLSIYLSFLLSFSSYLLSLSLSGHNIVRCLVLQLRGVKGSTMRFGWFE